MRFMVIITALLAGVSFADDLSRHAFTLSAGIPGFVLPEIGYEYSLSRHDRIGVSAGTVWVIPTLRVNYARISGGLELMGSAGRIGSLEDHDFGLLSGVDPLYFVSATAGYRSNSSGGFIFRAAGGGALFFSDEDPQPVPFVQVGIGYGF